MSNSGLDRLEESLWLALPAGRRRCTLRAAMEHFRVPGLSLAVIHNGEVLGARAYGVAAADDPSPVSVHTRFQACSISKAVTSIGLLRLVQSGLIDLDRDVNDMLRTWQIPRNADWQPRISLRQLASHRGGLSVAGFPGYRATDQLPTLPEVLAGAPPANTRGVRAELPPGLRFRYSGGGTTVLQQVLEDTQGVGFAALMRHLVLEPAGMTDSGFSTRCEGDVEVASGHDWEGEVLPGRFRRYPELAAAGLWSTAADLARLVTLLEGCLDGSGDLLESALARSTIVRPLAQITGSGLFDGVGVGFFLGAAGGGRYFGHAGSNAGFRCLLLGEQTQRVGLVVMTNGEDGAGLVRAIVEAAAEAFGWPGAGQLDITRVGRREPSAPGSGWKVFVGPAGQRLRLSVGDGIAVAEFDGQAPLRFIQGDDAEFTAEEVGTRLTLGHANGVTDHVHVTDDTDQMTFHPDV